MVARRLLFRSTIRETTISRSECQLVVHVRTKQFSKVILGIARYPEVNVTWPVILKPSNVLEGFSWLRVNK